MVFKRQGGFLTAALLIRAKGEALEKIAAYYTAKIKSSATISASDKKRNPLRQNGSGFFGTYVSQLVRFEKNEIVRYTFAKRRTEGNYRLTTSLSENSKISTAFCSSSFSR